MRRFNFTKKSLDALRTDGKQWSYFHDTQVPGLTIGVSPTGTKAFVLYRRIAGRPERITLGRYPEFSIEQARGAAQEKNAAIAKGENPREEQRVMKQENTLGEFFDIYLENHAKVHKRTWENDVRVFNKHLAKWRNLRLSEISKMDAVNLKNDIGRKSGHYAANRVLELVSALFNKAIQWGWKGSNPAHGVDAFPEHSRERFLQVEELPRFFTSLAAEENETIRDYIFLSLFSGARRSNVQAMRWEEINFERATWRIPVTKHGDAETLSLSPEAIAILERRQESAKESAKQKDGVMSPWVFPGCGKSGHLMEPKSAWKRICDRAKIRDLRIHDLRRTLGSWQAANGASLLVIGKSLGHKPGSPATAVYSRLNLDPVRASVNQATAAMMQAGAKPVPSGALILEGATDAK